MSISSHRYSYVRNNPLKYTDPSGFWSWPEGWKIKAIEFCYTQTNCFFSLPLGIRRRKRSSRLYDPTLARMLNADPFIFDPSFSQDFNRYSPTQAESLILIQPEASLRVKGKQQ